MASEESKIRNRTIRQVSATDSQIESFILRLERFLSKNLDDILDDVAQGKTLGLEAANILGGLLSELKARGLDKEVGKIRTIYAEELRFIKDELAEIGFDNPFSDTDKQIIDALIETQTSRATNQLEKFGIDIQSQLIGQVITGQQPDLKGIKETLTPRLEANIRTELNTAVMAFNRTVTAKKAEELGIELFLYVGPDDRITRPFCDKLLNKNPPIYTRSEISALNNGQGLDVFTYGGGYNCRHHWRALTEDKAKELGYGI